MVAPPGTRLGQRDHRPDARLRQRRSSRPPRL